MVRCSQLFSYLRKRNPRLLVAVSGKPVQRHSELSFHLMLVLRHLFEERLGGIAPKEQSDSQLILSLRDGRLEKAPRSTDWEVVPVLWQWCCPSDQTLRFKEMAMEASPVFHQLLLVFALFFDGLGQHLQPIEKRSVEMRERLCHPLVLLQPIDRIFDTNV